MTLFARLYIMKNDFKGRIFDTWKDQNRYSIELCAGSAWHRFWTDNTDISNLLRRGQLVALSTTEQNEIVSLEILAVPERTEWDLSTDSGRWQKTLGGPSLRERLQQRQCIISAIREDLYGQDFLEVETPLLVKSTCPDLHIDSIQAGEGYLVTSTEYQIKRMIVGGFERVFTLTKNFRANDRGRYHSCEFTMLEWARAYETLHEIEEDAIRFIRKAFRKLYPEQDKLNFETHEIDFMSQPWERLTVREAFERYLGLSDLQDFSLEALCLSAKKAEVVLPQHFQQDKYLVMSYLFDLLQHHLGTHTPTFLQEWPAYLTTSAPICKNDPTVAERSELYVAGIEIADGFPFLRDAKKQRALFAEALQLRQEKGKLRVEIDEPFLEALGQGLPPGAGMALGVDRLVMVLTGASRLQDVQAFDWDEL